MTFAPLALRIAGELGAMAQTTERLAEALCGDEEMARRCLPLLQHFDLLAQQQAELSALLARLGAGCEPAEAVGEIRLSALAERLGRAA